MATVTLFNAARMQAIEDGTVVSGLVDTNGHLILTKHDTTTVDAGNVKGLQGNPGVNGYYLLPGFPENVRSYVRLATIDGGNAFGGAHIQFLLSGLGDYGTIARGTALVHMTQRDSNIVNLRTWGWGFDTATQPLILYTLQKSEFVFEVWGRFAPFSMNAGLTVLANSNGTVNVDSRTGTAPSNLVTQVIDNADDWVTIKNKPTAFPPSGHNHAATDISQGTLDNLRLPGRLQETSLPINGLDLNTIINSGWYKGDSLGNGPVTNWLYIEVIAHVSIWVHQRAIGLGPVSDHVDNTWERWLANGSWTAWRVMPTRIATDAEVLAGTNTGIAVSPAGLQARINEEIWATGSMGSVTGNAVVPFASGMVLTGGMTQPSESTLVVPKAGLYVINMAQLIQPNGAAYYHFRINENLIYYAYTPGTFGDLHIDTVRKLNAGDSLSFYYAGNNPSTSWQTPHSQVSVAKIK